jgi:hypothetical protein
MMESTRDAVQGSQVAAMRRKAKELRETLAAKLKASSAASDAISANKEISSLITAVAAAQARESMHSMHTQMNASAQNSSSVLLDDGTVLSETEVLELEMLQLENEQLRCGADACMHLGCRLPCLHGGCRCVHTPARRAAAMPHVRAHGLRCTGARCVSPLATAPVLAASGECPRGDEPSRW